MNLTEFFDVSSVHELNCLQEDWLILQLIPKTKVDEPLNIPKPPNYDSVYLSDFEKKCFLRIRKRIVKLVIFVYLLKQSDTNKKLVNLWESTTNQIIKKYFKFLIEDILRCHSLQLNKVVFSGIQGCKSDCKNKDTSQDNDQNSKQGKDEELNKVSKDDNWSEKKESIIDLEYFGTAENCFLFSNGSMRFFINKTENGKLISLLDKFLVRWSNETFSLLIDHLHDLLTANEVPNSADTSDTVSQALLSLKRQKEVLERKCNQTGISVQSKADLDQTVTSKHSVDNSIFHVAEIDRLNEPSDLNHSKIGDAIIERNSLSGCLIIKSSSTKENEISMTEKKTKININHIIYSSLSQKNYTKVVNTFFLIYRQHLTNNGLIKESRLNPAVSENILTIIFRIISLLDEKIWIQKFTLLNHALSHCHTETIKQFAKPLHEILMLSFPTINFISDAENVLVLYLQTIIKFFKLVYPPSHPILFLGVDQLLSLAELSFISRPQYYNIMMIELVPLIRHLKVFVTRLAKSFIEVCYKCFDFWDFRLTMSTITFLTELVQYLPFCVIDQCAEQLKSHLLEIFTTYAENKNHQDILNSSAKDIKENLINLLSKVSYFSKNEISDALTILTADLSKNPRAISTSEIPQKLNAILLSG